MIKNEKSLVLQGIISTTLGLLSIAWTYVPFVGWLLSLGIVIWTLIVALKLKKSSVANIAKAAKLQIASFWIGIISVIAGFVSIFISIAFDDSIFVAIILLIILLLAIITTILCLISLILYSISYSSVASSNSIKNLASNSKATDQISKNQNNSLETKLVRLKKLFDEGTITKDEYNKKRKDILDQI